MKSIIPQILGASVLCLFTGCATNFPPFQESKDGSSGYKITDGVTAKNFLINVSLPESEATKHYTDDYLIRAVGETCLTRGFFFFDPIFNTETIEKNHIFIAAGEGRCHEEGSKNGIGMTLKEANTNAYGAKTQVEVFNTPEGHQLKIDDYVLEVENTKVSRAFDIGTIISTLPKDQKTVDVLIVRDGQKMKVTETLRPLINYTYGPEELRKLRQYVK